MPVKKANKSTLQGLLSGEEFPNPPSFSKNWSLEQYNAEWQTYVRKLQDYIRRLMGQLTGTNILNEITQNTSTTNVFGNGFVDVFREGNVLTFIRGDGTTKSVEICECEDGCFCENYYSATNQTSALGVSIGTLAAGTYCFKYMDGAFRDFVGGLYYARGRLNNSSGTTIVEMNGAEPGYSTVSEAVAGSLASAGTKGTFTLLSPTELFIAVADDDPAGNVDPVSVPPVRYRICKIS